MILKKKNAIPYYAFSHFSSFPGLSHGVFTREGGVSPPPFDTLNIGFSVGDDPARVEENRKRMLSLFPAKTPVFLHQVHGTACLVLPEGQEKPGLPPAADAVITNAENLHLVIQTADCQAVLVYDPVSRTIAGIHAGWRGCISGITEKVICLMEKEFCAKPQNMLAGISPSLGPCCGEFIHYKKEIPGRYWEFRVDETHFDFPAITRSRLIASGLQPENIEVSSICTKCNSRKFFSYRAEGKTGRFASVISLEKPVSCQ